MNFQFRSQYQFMPPLNETDRANLKHSIEEEGILQPVLTDEEGYVLDGHNRVEIARELGVLDSQIPTVMKVGMDESQKLVAIAVLNVARRHMTTKEKVQALLIIEPIIAAQRAAHKAGDVTLESLFDVIPSEVVTMTTPPLTGRLRAWSR